jgi:hypothetical protein
MTTQQEEITYEGVKACGAVAIAEFAKLLGRGESVSMAAMLATRTPPALGNSDQTFNRNRRSLLDQFGGNTRMLDMYNQNYRAETGEDIPGDAFVFRGLAKYPGDPGAILTHKHTLADVKRVMKDRNVEIEGDWEQAPVSQAPKPQEVRMRPDLVDKYAAEYVHEQPDLAKLDLRELRELVVDTMAPKVDEGCLDPLGVTEHEALSEKVFQV